MAVTQLKLSNFRNLAALTLAVPQNAAVVALVGPNGVGKTSVLEALSLFTPTRGLLGAEGKAQIRHGQKEWGLWAAFTNHESRITDHEIGQTFRKAERLLHVDGHKQALEGLAKLHTILWLTPATDFLFSGPPAGRRRWLDDATTALIPAHAQAVARFAQHRQARLKLLVQGRADDWLEAEEKLCAEWGIQVLRHRQEYLAALVPHLGSSLTLQLAGNALAVLEDADPVMALKGKFERSRDIDTRMERTHAGPNTLEVTGHLTLEDGTTTTLAQASSGQHKRGLIHWLVAHVQLLKTHLKQPPVVLIDEFSAHLDAARRGQLLTTLGKLGCQVWLTDTEAPALPHAHIIRLDEV
ncbi:MAG: AAA family ATPase [Proteobacteria bacterium]|nr:AAA family ATPase [Pseudomonadota bacterium]